MRLGSGAAVIAISLLLSGCIGDPTYAVVVQNHCKSALQYAIAEPDDDSDDLLASDDVWADVAIDAETSIGIATYPMDVRVLIANRDGSLGADIFVPAGNIDEPQVVPVEGDNCPS